MASILCSIRLKILFIIGFFGTFVCNVSAADEYAEWLSNAENELKEVVLHQKNLLKSNGSRELQDIIDSVDIDIVTNGIQSPFVTKSWGVRPKITLSADFMLLLKFVGDTSLSDFSDKSTANCAMGYLEKIREIMYRNISRSEQGQALARIIPPEIYASQRGSTCAKFGAQFPIPGSKREFRDRAIRSTVAFSWLHEIGHIALGHSPINVTNLAGSTSQVRLEAVAKKLKESRAQESAADLWAAETLARTGGRYPDMVNLVLTNYLLTATGMDCYTEIGGTHPNGLRRFVRSLNQFKLANEAALGERWPAVAVELTTDLTKFAEKVAVALGCPTS